MARIIGGIGTTHVPSIGKAIAEGKQNDPYWSPFFAASTPCTDGSRASSPTSPSCSPTITA